MSEPGAVASATPASVAVADIDDLPDPSLVSVRSKRSGRSNWPRPLAAGFAAAIVVFVLRDVGLIVGVWTLPLVLLCFVLAPGPRRIADRSLLTFALVLGWLPLVGWLPGIGLRIDVPGVTLAIAVGAVSAYQLHLERAEPRTVARPSAAEIAALGAGALVTLWSAWPFKRLGDSGILQGLFSTGWDNAPHFDMYRENLQLGSFLQTSTHLASGAPRLGYDYPQGIHQAWAQITRLYNPHPPSSVVWLLHSYVGMLVLMTAVIVVMGCMAVTRACGQDLVAAGPAMAVVVALFGMGRFTSLDGFPNYALAVIAAAVGVSLLLRPTLSTRLNFFAVAGMGLVVAYNWYPLFLLMAPALVVAALRARAESHGRSRWVMTGFIAATAVATVLPATSFAHRGVSWLDVNGAWPAPPWGLVIACIAALILVAIVRQTVHPDLTTNVILGSPAVLGGGAALIVVLYTAVSASDGMVTYYGVKISAGMLGVCLTVLALVIASDVAASKFRWRLSRPVAALAAVILTVAALQVDGYLGPESVALRSTYTAPGINVHYALEAAPIHSVWAEQVLLSAQASRGRPGQWFYVDPPAFIGDRRHTDLTPNNPALMSEWFFVLRGDPSNTGYNRGILVNSQTQLQSEHTRRVTAETVIRDFPQPIAHHVHLFVPWWLKISIVQLDPIWSQAGLLYVIPVPLHHHGNSVQQAPR